MWLFKTLITLYILVAFCEHRTSSTNHWPCGTRGCTEGSIHADTNSIPLSQPKVTTSSSRTFDRSKRDVVKQQNYTIELLIAVDQTMMDYHTDKLEEYVLTLMSSASRFFVHKSIGNPIDLAVVDIIKVDLKAEKCDTLDAFCHYIQQNFNHSHYDTALLFTRSDFRDFEEMKKFCITSNDTLGEAYVRTMCSAESCTVVKDVGPSQKTASTVAHELAHLLSAEHDDMDVCAAFQDLEIRNHIMWPISAAGQYSWSNCSRHFISEFLKTNVTKCLRNSNPINKLTEFRSIENQCKLAGMAEHFSLEKTSAKLSCEHMICYNESNAEYPFNKCWRDGTECGEGKWCQRIECVKRSENTDAGQWYSWTIQWGECSDLCNGIQYASAYCVDESNQTVLDYLCCGYQHNSNHRPCNIDCYVGWESELSPCSAECTNGTQNLTYSCVQRFTSNNSSSKDVDDSDCPSEKPLRKTQECVGLCESAKWNYTEYEPCSCNLSEPSRSAYCISNDNRVDPEHCKRLPLEDLNRSCPQQNCSIGALTLTIIIVVCVALFIIVLYKLTTKVIAYRKSKDPETDLIVQLDQLDEISEYNNYNRFQLK